MNCGENTLKSAQVRRNFSRHAVNYDDYARVQRIVAAQLLQRLPAAPVTGRVLEIGSGTGLLSRLFLQQNPDARLVLSDIAHGMNCRLATEFPRQPVTDADAAALPFSDASFDLVLSSSVYQWVEDLSGAFCELHRVLRPGGCVVIALFGVRTLFELRQSHAQALCQKASHSQRFPDCRRLEAALTNRFKIELLQRTEEREWHAGVPQLLRSLKAIGAQNVSRKRPSGLASRRTMQRMYDCYHQRFGVGEKIPATYEVIYLSASRI